MLPQGGWIYEISPSAPTRLSARLPHLARGVKSQKASQVHDFIRKPFQFGDLAQTLRGVAGGMGPKVDRAR